MNAKRKWSTLLPAILAEAWFPVNIVAIFITALYVIGIPDEILHFFIVAAWVNVVVWGVLLGSVVWASSKWFPSSDTKQAWLLVWSRSPMRWIEKVVWLIVVIAFYVYITEDGEYVVWRRRIVIGAMILLVGIFLIVMVANVNIQFLGALFFTESEEVATVL